MDDAQRASQSIEPFRSGVTDDGHTIAADRAASVRGTAEGVGVNFPLDDDTKKWFVHLAFQQGFPAFMLLCVMVFLAYAVIYLIPEIDKKRTEDLTTKFEAISAGHDKVLQQLIESHSEDRRVFVEIMRTHIPALPKPAEAR